MNGTEPSQTMSSVPIGQDQAQARPIASDYLVRMMGLVLWTCMFPINLTGIITNIINSRVFLKQGVRNDSTNAGFLSLSLFDLFSCVTSIPYSFCFVVIFTHGSPEHVTCRAYATFGLFVHAALHNMSTWITVYISLIRSLCVTFPLKVKLMFTPKVTVIVILFIFCFFLPFQFMYSAFIKIVWIFHPRYNTSIAVAVDSPMAQNIFYYQQLITKQILPAIAISIVTINTGLMFRKLLEVRKWRLQNSSDSKRDDCGTNSSEKSKKPLASKDIELIKFMSTTTSIYLFCVLMGFIPSIAIMAFPEVGFTGLNKNLFQVTFMIRFFFDTINSSFNLFFYIRVSSRFKSAFASSFHSSCNKNVSKP